eukprot:1790843-Pyramimonas_sp.AAC.1
MELAPGNPECSQRTWRFRRYFVPLMYCTTPTPSRCLWYSSLLVGFRGYTRRLDLTDTSPLPTGGVAAGVPLGPQMFSVGQLTDLAEVAVKSGCFRTAGPSPYTLVRFQAPRCAVPFVSHP